MCHSWLNSSPFAGFLLECSLLSAFLIHVALNVPIYMAWSTSMDSIG